MHSFYLCRVALHDAQAFDVYLRWLAVGRQKRQDSACALGCRVQRCLGLLNLLVLKQL